MKIQQKSYTMKKKEKKQLNLTKQHKTINLLRDYEGGNDAFLTSLVVCKHAIY